MTTGGKPLSDDAADEFLPEPEPATPARATTPVAPGDVIGRAREAWEKGPGADASKFDSRLLLEGLRSGLSEERAWDVVCLHPGSKAARDGRADDSHKASAVKWARKQFTADAAALTLVDHATADDAFSKSVIGALARVQKIRNSAFYGALARLAKEGIPKPDLKKRVAEYRTEQRARTTKIVRLALTETGDKAVGIWIMTKRRWASYPNYLIHSLVKGAGLDMSKTMAALRRRPWTMANEPFKEEDLPGRRWNKDAARLAFVPKEGPHPMWDQLFRVLGRGIDDGATYLLNWCGSVFQRPEYPLPYLFFWGEKQNTGKTMFHEALRRLLTKGYCLAKEAIENRAGFCGELAGAIICAVEEIAVPRRAYARIKDWITNESILIVPKGETPYRQPNRTHWIQTGNSLDDLALVEGDTRITAIECFPVETSDRRNKQEMLRGLEAEAPAILWTLLHAALPPPGDRMGLEVIDTLEKKEAQARNREPVEEFCATHPEWQEMTNEEIYAAFVPRLPEREQGEWSPHKLRAKLPGSGLRLRGVVLWLRENVGWTGPPAELAPRLSLSPAALGILLKHPLAAARIQRKTVHGKRLIVVAEREPPRVQGTMV